MKKNFLLSAMLFVTVSIITVSCKKETGNEIKDPRDIYRPEVKPGAMVMSYTGFTARQFNLKRFNAANGSALTNIINQHFLNNNENYIYAGLAINPTLSNGFNKVFYTARDLQPQSLASYQFGYLTNNQDANKLNAAVGSDFLYIENGGKTTLLLPDEIEFDSNGDLYLLKNATLYKLPSTNGTSGLCQYIGDLMPASIFYTSFCLARNGNELRLIAHKSYGIVQVYSINTGNGTISHIQNYSIETFTTAPPLQSTSNGGDMATYYEAGTLYCLLNNKLYKANAGTQHMDPIAVIPMGAKNDASNF